MQVHVCRTTAGDPNRRVLVQYYICTLACGARFRNKRCFLVVIRGDGGCDWWYYRTRYVGEAERVGFGWKHGHFRRVKEQLC